MEAKLIKTDNDNYILVDPTKGVYDKGYLLGTSRESDVNKLSLKNCQSIDNGYDLDELKNQYIQEQLSKFDKESYERYFPFAEDEANILIDGFQKALEILGDKKFTYNQMVSAITESSISHRLPSLIIQDLQQTEWDVEICCHIDDHGTGNGSEDSFSHPMFTNTGIPKYDADGNLILKRK